MPNSSNGAAAPASSVCGPREPWRDALLYIDHAGVRFSVRFPEGALQTKQKADLQAAMHEVIEQVIGVSPRTPSKQFKSTLMLSFIESNPATVHRMAGEPTLRVLRP